MRRMRWWRDRTVRMRIGSMAALLILLVLNVFVVPFVAAPEGVFSRLARDVLLSLILLSGVAAVSEHRSQFVVILCVAAAAMLLRWSGWLFPSGGAPVLLDESVPFSLGILGAVIGINVFSGGVVTIDRILGAVALYILIGIVWANAYQLVGVHVPDAYAGMRDAGDPADPTIWIYFSFVTLTTVGYGDLTPLAHAAKSLVIIEALIGQLYPAIVLARLVSLRAASEEHATRGPCSPR